MPILKRKEVVRNCIAHRRVKLLEHDMKIVIRVLEKKFEN